MYLRFECDIILLRLKLGVILSRKGEWGESINGEFLQQLKNANIRSSNSKKLKKVIFLLLGVLLVVFAITIPTLIFRYNRPFDLVITTNVASMQQVEVRVEKGSRLYAIQPAEIEGYDFVGWYKDSNFTIEFIYTEKIDKNTKLYAAYQLKKFSMNIPINDAYTIDIEDDNSTIYWGGDFMFTLNINPGYVVDDIQIMANGSMLHPISTTRDSVTYMVENVRGEIDFELVGAVSKLVVLTVYVDGVPTEYEVKDTNNLQRYYTSINRQGYTEYNTTGLFIDNKFTKPADLSKRIYEDTTVYTKISTVSPSLAGLTWDESSNSWHVDLRRISSSKPVALPSKYTNGIHDGYITKIYGSASGNVNSTISNIYLPATITTLGEYAFYNFTNLQSVSIPESVTLIENAVFQNCSKLSSVVIPNGVTNIGNFTFDNCLALSSIDISKSIIGIGYYAFNNCKNLQSINFADNARLTNIGGMAFANCTSLKQISIPNSVTIIGYQNFYGCTALETVELPEGLEIISDYAFYNCTKLFNISIPDSVQIIGAYAFYSCSNLQNITLPSNITQINSNSFRNCVNLTNITIPNSVINISDAAFYGCSRLESVDLSDNVITLGSQCFAYCTKLKNITLPNSLTTLSSSLFTACTSLSKITIPASITSWSTYIFNGCSGLKEVIIDEEIGIKLIPSYTFYNCSSLENVSMSSSISKIDSYAFYNCQNLNEINMPNAVTAINISAFYNCKKLTKLRLPDNLVTIEARAFEKCENIEIIENVTTKLKTINDYAFSDCSKLNNVIIPSSITTFGTHVFNGCVNLKNVTIENASIYSKIVDLHNPGYLITYAESIKVLKSIVDAGVSNYLTENYLKSSDGNYYKFTLV